jgi:hypothetical protein
LVLHFRNQKLDELTEVHLVEGIRIRDGVGSLLRGLALNAANRRGGHNVVPLILGKRFFIERLAFTSYAGESPAAG